MHTAIIIGSICAAAWFVRCMWKSERDFIASLSEEDAGNYPGPM
jgi:hypothetical protein